MHVKNTMRGVASGLLCTAGLMLSACGDGSSRSSGSTPITVGGTVTGLVTGASLEIENDGGRSLDVIANGNFIFSPALRSGAGYDVTIAGQPAGENCSVTNGSGTVGTTTIANVLIACTPERYTISGVLAGLQGGRTLVVQNNGGNGMTLSANGNFSFSTSVPSGSNYAVTILTQPAGQSCAVTKGSGLVGAANVTNVSISCSDDTYNVGVTVSGVSASGLQLAINGTDTLTVAASGTFNFNTPIASGSPYAVTILSQPLGETCTVTNGIGTIVSSNVSNVTVSCVSKLYPISGTLTGLLSGRSLILQDNGTNNTTVAANGAFSFSTPVASASGYSVTVLSQPTGQNCAVTNGSGTVAASPVSNVSIACSDNTYNIGVTVSGLTGNGLVLEDNGGDNLPISASGSVNFATPIPSGSTYAVTVLIQPAGQTCTVTGGSGTVTSSNVSGITVSCVNIYTIGGGVSGLISGTLVLQDNGGDDLTVSANGSFTFATPIVDGNPYAVTILTQPQGQTCALSNASGTVSAADVTNVTVTCGDLWIWVSGSNGASASGVYGTRGAASTGNVPGARWEAVSWTDRSGNLWLFGGYGDESAGGSGYLNDLWEFNPTAGTWAWDSGSSTANASGVYGTPSVASINSVPGARQGAVSWTDASGNLWLFGGYGYDSLGTHGYLNDLWEYNPTAGTWTWVSGSNVDFASGVYGTQGVPSTSNVPGARYDAISWTDSAGNLWLFGGYGYSSGSAVLFNDLWKFNPTAGTWEWVSGSNSVFASGVYGTQGVPSTSNVPGARDNAISWTDSTGNLWLLGGYGLDSSSHEDLLNDLWEFNPTAGTWTWVSGSNVTDASGVYGTQGVASTNNVPGARSSAISWSDAAGNLWLSGGYGFDSSGNEYLLNDLWKFNPTAGTWDWVSGSNTLDAIGVYGIQGTASTSNLPASRYYSISWTDSSGNLWLFGGYGYSSSGGGYLNDLWEFVP